MYVISDETIIGGCFLSVCVCDGEIAFGANGQRMTDCNMCCAECVDIITKGGVNSKKWQMAKKKAYSVVTIAMGFLL